MIQVRRSKFQVAIVPFTIVVFFSFLLIAVALFPEPYVFWYESISTLGVAGENPLGWPFFTIAFLCLGGLLIPYFINLFRILRDKVKVVTVFMLIFAMLACAGMFVIAIFQEMGEYKRFHYYASIIALGGVFASAICSWFPFAKKIKEKATSKGVACFLLVIMAAVFIIAASGLITILVLQETAGLGYITEGKPLMGFPFWEWTILFATGVHVVGSWGISTFLLDN